MTYTLHVEKWQVRPEAKWILLRDEEVEVRETPKRIKVTSGMHRGKVFDRQTGREITSTRFSWFKYSLQISKEAAA